jgi:hypothetical protein
VDAVGDAAARWLDGMAGHVAMRIEDYLGFCKIFFATERFYGASDAK